MVHWRSALENLSSFFCNKKVFVTGAQGFKGSWLCMALKLLGARVHGYGLTNSSSASLHNVIRNFYADISFIDGDIRDFERLSKAMREVQPDIVFHLAAEPLVKTGYDVPRTVFDVNVMGTVTLMEATRTVKNIGCVINVTTDKVYANNGERYLFTEEDALGGDDPYSASKACSELVTQSYAKSFFKQEMGVATARAGNVIGPGDFAENRLIPDIIRAVETGRCLEIRSPKAVRPWQHVADPILGYLRLAHKVYLERNMYFGSFNFGPRKNQVLSVKELIDLLHSNNILQFDVETVENFIVEKEFLNLDSTRAATLLNWKNESDIVLDLKYIVEGYARLNDQDSFISHSNEVMQVKLEV